MNKFFSFLHAFLAYLKEVATFFRRNLGFSTYCLLSPTFFHCKKGIYCNILLHYCNYNIKFYFVLRNFSTCYLKEIFFLTFFFEKNFHKIIKIYSRKKTKAIKNEEISSFNRNFMTEARKAGKKSK